MDMIAIANLKGGVGKTTTTQNLGTALAMTGRNVLLIDADPQASLTHALGLEDGPTIADALLGTSLTRAVQHAAHVSAIPASPRMQFQENAVTAEIGWEQALRELLRDNGGFDLVLIDCPPSLIPWTVLALTAATELILPVTCEPAALTGLAKMTAAVAKVQLRLNADLALLGVLPVRYDGRLRVAREGLATLRTRFPATLLPPVRTNVSLAEAAGHQRPIFEYAPKSHGAADYLATAAALLDRLAKRRTA